MQAAALMQHSSQALCKIQSNCYHKCYSAAFKLSNVECRHALGTSKMQHKEERLV